MNNNIKQVPLLVATHRCVRCNFRVMTTFPTNPEQLEAIVGLLNQNNAGCEFSMSRFVSDHPGWKPFCRVIGKQSRHEDGIKN